MRALGCLILLGLLVLPTPAPAETVTSPAPGCDTIAYLLAFDLYRAADQTALALREMLEGFQRGKCRWVPAGKTVTVIRRDGPYVLVDDRFAGAVWVHARLLR